MTNKEVKELIAILELIENKENMLREIVVWLRSKGLWEECQKDLITKIAKEPK